MKSRMRAQTKCVQQMPLACRPTAVIRDGAVAAEVGRYVDSALTARPSIDNYVGWLVRSSSRPCGSRLFGADYTIFYLSGATEPSLGH